MLNEVSGARMHPLRVLGVSLFGAGARVQGSDAASVVHASDGCLTALVSFMAVSSQRPIRPHQLDWRARVSGGAST